MTEKDLAIISELLPADLELDPSATRFDLADPDASRRLVVYQTYWKAVGAWTPQSWALHFIVEVSGRPVGVQVLEGEDFLTVRTVDSASWLATHARGKGLGKEMRKAVLALAFGPLEARAAISSAWHDNVASLRVSKALGYRPNGALRHARERVGADEMIHLRLDRADWLASRLATDVTITGFDPCRPLFGLPAAPAGEA